MNAETSGMRIAILTHSTNARGGVSHSLALAEALKILGHSATVHAPDPTGRGFYRETAASTLSVDAVELPNDMLAMVETRVAEYVAHFEKQSHRRFDIYHAQDGISGNALATLKQRGLISGFVRTVHHMDQFNNAQLNLLQRRSVESADEIFVVSDMWGDKVRSDYGVSPTLVGNGVDLSRYMPSSSVRDASLRDYLALENGPVFLSVGGIEERKNTLRILRAFKQIQALHPSAQLIIAGGASVLDHSVYQHEFKDLLAKLSLPARSVIRTGAIAEPDMYSLYRLADVLVFASVSEGFGLAVLEAMASGLPVVTSRIAPFTEYLSEADVVWCDPLNVGSIANAMGTAMMEGVRTKVIRNGYRVAATHTWQKCAIAHLPVYQKMRITVDA